jgi:hypothetical protein
MAAYTTIDNPELYFQTKLYTGNGSAQSITLDGDEDMQPDMVWFKKRSSQESHYLYDAVRGVTKEIYPNATAAESTDANSLTGFDSDGFSIGNANALSENTETMVAWCWKETATAGFDIVSYTGDGSARTISHSLSAVPNFIWIKCRNVTHGSAVYHSENTSAPETDHLSTTFNSATADNANYWNDTAPTSSVFSVGTQDDVNQNTKTFIAFLWTNIQGYSKFGGYTGNGSSSTDGAFINLGFRPAFVLIKRTNGDKDWKLFDNKRPGYNGEGDALEANNDDAEDSTEFLDFLSNGFKIRIPSSDGKYADVNGEDDTFVYAAFAEAPFVNSKGVPCNAR